MVVINGDGEAAMAIDCPVIKEWMGLEALVERAAKGQIAIAQGKKLTRDTVADNHEVLGPLISHYGILACLQLFSGIVELFD